MANVQDMKALKAEKTLRLLTVLLLVVGIVLLAATVYDVATGSSLFKLFDAASETAETDTNQGGLLVAQIMLMASSALMIAAAVMQIWKKNYRAFQSCCIASIIFGLFPLIFFAVNIGAHLFALIYAVLILAGIVMAIFAMKSRWQVYIKEMTGEVKKLTWLSVKELVKATAVVLVFVLAFALLIYVLDLIFYTPVSAILHSDRATATEAPVQEQPATNDGTVDSTENNG